MKKGNKVICIDNNFVIKYLCLNKIYLSLFFDDNKTYHIIRTPGGNRRFKYLRFEYINKLETYESTR